MNGRNYLTGSIYLSRSEDKSSSEVYYIKAIVGEGGSAVCYEAERKLENGIVETGKLKEFYPMDSVTKNQSWYYSLKRLSNNQLVAQEGKTEKFREECEDYIHTYKLLKKVMADNPENEVLKNYIQHGEVLYGCAGKEEGVYPTVYIWSPGMLGKSFDLYLREVKKNPLNRPEERLRDILSVIDAVTDCVKALHTAGLLHMDIKPSNFLVPYDSDFSIKPNQISLFDINTLCSVESEFFRMVGTRGYSAPEVMRGRADNRSDLYSIGAMLFYAIVIVKEIPDGLYQDKYYGRIDQLVRNSELFLASEVNSDAMLMSEICKILEKCLARNPRKRYQSCTDLREDLSKVRRRLNKMLWRPVKKSKEGLTDPTIVIQKLLYEHPLYDAVCDGEKDLNILVIGSGTYGQRFIDICMQSGQMSETRLNITAISDETEEDLEAYLRFRPALCEFVNVNHSLKGREERAFANLEFRSIPRSAQEKGETYEIRFARNEAINRKIVRDIMEEARERENPYHYIFVALGEDKMSEEIARLCMQYLSEDFGRICPVCYVSQETRGKKTAQEKSSIEEKVDSEREEMTLYPVYINEPITDWITNQNFGQMAFNTHISWNTKKNMDMASERERFFKSEKIEDKYNRTSSLAYALSIKYKLHSISIDCDDILEAANLFSEQILERYSFDEEAKQKFDQLIYLEHRRWLLEKVANGWTAPRDEDGKLRLRDCIFRGSVKDAMNRTHPCLVNASVGSPLSSFEYTKNHHAKWKEGEIDENLDELDQMSLMLHRCLSEQAEQLKYEGLLHNPDLISIEQMLPVQCEDLLRAFRQFQFALKNILSGVKSYSLQYNYYEDVFLEAIEEEMELSSEKKVKIKRRLYEIKKMFFSIVESNLYRDYKKNNEILIKKIPFILTYRHVSCIAMAFEDSKNQNGKTAFENVAAATVLNPEKICFLYCMEAQADIHLFLQRLESVLNYFGKRKVHCKIEVILSFIREGVKEESALQQLYSKEEYLQRELLKLQGNYCGSQREREYVWRNDTKNELRNELRNERKNGESLRLAEISQFVPVSNVLFEKFEIFNVEHYEEAKNVFVHYLKENPVDLYDGGNVLFPSVFDNALFLGEITKLHIPYFEFDWRNKKFIKHMQCEYLKFVKDSSFIRILDMFSLMNMASSHFQLLELADDYEQLWKIYTGEYLCKERRGNIDMTGSCQSESCLSDKTFEIGVENWNRLCRCLEKYERNQKPLARLLLNEKRASAKGEIKTLLYYLPEYTFLTVKMILQRLIDCDAAKPQSSLIHYASDTCKLELVIEEQYEQQLNAVFSNPQVLLPYYGLEVRKYKIHSEEYVEIRRNNLTVENINLDENGEGILKDVFLVLKQLEKARFITQLKQNFNHAEFVSFVYSSPRIKQVLTAPEKILEVYAYYDILKTGYFDDVISNCEICLEPIQALGEDDIWGEREKKVLGREKKEEKVILSLVLTKGFRSMIVECKTDAVLKLDDYYKLDSIANQFGIGTTKVMIGNTYKNSDLAAKEYNVIQEERGNQFQIKTISDRRELAHIGQTLRRLMEEERKDMEE